MLRERLVERQRQDGLRDGEMAKLLGMPRTSYSSLKVGRYGISMRVAKRIAAVYPDLAPLALIEDPEEEAAAKEAREARIEKRRATKRENGS